MIVACLFFIAFIALVAYGIRLYIKRPELWDLRKDLREDDDFGVSYFLNLSHPNNPLNWNDD